MENTQENKERFFAQYWGQYVGRCNFNRLTIVGDTYLPEPIEYLQLRTIKQMTNEEILEVAKMITRFEWNLDLGYNIIKEDNQIRVYYNKVQSRYRHINDGYACTITIYDDLYGKETSSSITKPLSAKIYDYLRSRGILTPYGNLLEEEIIEYGWAKIITP